MAQSLLEHAQRGGEGVTTGTGVVNEQEVHEAKALLIKTERINENKQSQVQAQAGVSAAFEDDDDDTEDELELASCRIKEDPLDDALFPEGSPASSEGESQMSRALLASKNGAVGFICLLRVNFPGILP